jgi:hypothetical protein
MHPSWTVFFCRGLRGSVAAEASPFPSNRSTIFGKSARESAVVTKVAGLGPVRPFGWHGLSWSVTNDKDIDFEMNAVATAQLATDRQIEPCKPPKTARAFQPGAEAPDLLGKNRAVAATA